MERNFQVTRCNQCEEPPCAEICPTGAMFQRDDGIVDFNRATCIGCKACIAACPYDAIYIDPETNTAAKCHYCSHRTDRGLEPACVVVCPTHAIISGDMDDPESEISQVLDRLAELCPSASCRAHLAHAAPPLQDRALMVLAMTRGIDLQFGTACEGPVLLLGRLRATITLCE